LLRLINVMLTPMLNLNEVQNVNKGKNPIQVFTWIELGKKFVLTSVTAVASPSVA